MAPYDSKKEENFIVVYATDDSTGHGKRGLGSEGLDFEEERTLTFHNSCYGPPGDVLAAVSFALIHKCEWIVYFGKSYSCHLEYPNLIGRAEAILIRTKYSKV